MDFDDATRVFAGLTYELTDARHDYGEVRIVCYGYLEGRMVVVCYTPRGSWRRIISMRKANDREKAPCSPHLRE